MRESGEWWWLKRRRREEGRSANRENVGRFQLQLYTLSKVDTSLSFSFFFLLTFQECFYILESSSISISILFFFSGFSFLIFPRLPLTIPLVQRTGPSYSYDGQTFDYSPLLRPVEPPSQIMEWNTLKVSPHRTSRV